MDRLYRIALAAVPFPRSIEEVVSQVDASAGDAAARGAKIICFPESYLPGYHGPDGGETVAPYTARDVEAALERVCGIARARRIAILLPMDAYEPTGAVLNAVAVVSAEGAVVGRQTKNQLDPSEDGTWKAGRGRSVFAVDGGPTFGIVICHEGFRYPETVRSAARRGAQIVFHPHYAGTNGEGARLTEWRAPQNPYYDSAMMCRALENTIYFASVNHAFAAAHSSTAILGPDGGLVSRLPYGQTGVLVADVDLSRATRELAMRCKADEYT